MKAAKILFLAFLFSSIAVLSTAQRIQFAYKNFEVLNSNLCVLLGDGSLEVFDLKTKKLLGHHKPDIKIKQLLKDHNHHIIVTNDSNSVFQFDLVNGRLRIIDDYRPSYRFFVAYNSLNKRYYITDYGIYDCSTNKYFMPGKEFNTSEQGRRGAHAWLSENLSYQYYIDSKDNFWISSGHGEWGTDVFAFNTVTNTYITMKGSIELPSFELNGKLYAVANDYFETEDIIELEKLNEKQEVFKAKIVYEAAKDKSFPYNKKLNSSPFFINSATYNSQNKAIYVMTSYELFVGNKEKDLSKFENWQKLNLNIDTQCLERPYGYLNGDKRFMDEYENLETSLKRLKSKIKEPPKRQPPKFENITKMEFTKDGELIMLAGYLGVGIYDGKQLTMLY